MKLLWVLWGGFVFAQTSPKPAATPGRGLYLSNCSLCHGVVGEGGRGPNLSAGVPVHGTTDADLRRVILKGVPGTPMPSFSFEPAELTQLVAHLRTLRSAQVAAKKPPGDAAAGRAIYDKLRCVSCHRIDKQGSAYGPDLSRAGAGRPIAYLRESITNPSADIPPGYRGVTVTTSDGTRITGARVNEDTFTIQLRNIAQQFLMFEKSELRELAERKESLMPAYTNLPPKDLDDLVSYLASLRGSVAGHGTKRAEGVR